LEKPSLEVFLGNMENMTDSEKIQAVHGNLAKIRIYYEDLNYQYIYQKESYTVRASIFPSYPS
jgi:hypothetical protein